MDYLPVFLNIKDQHCLVVGGNESAESKINLLLKAGAKVKVIAQTLKPALIDLISSGKIEHQSQPFADSDIDKCKLVIVADEDESKLIKPAMIIKGIRISKAILM